MTAEERRRRRVDQLMRIRLRVIIGRELDDRGITTPAGIGAAIGMAPAEATALLSRHQWRDSDLLLLEAAAARLGLQMPGSGPVAAMSFFSNLSSLAASRSISSRGPSPTASSTSLTSKAKWNAAARKPVASSITAR
jgi:hypothetical protein